MEYEYDIKHSEDIGLSSSPVSQPGSKPRTPPLISPHAAIMAAYMMGFDEEEMKVKAGQLAKAELETQRANEPTYEEMTRQRDLEFAQLPAVKRVSPKNAFRSATPSAPKLCRYAVGSCKRKKCDYMHLNEHVPTANRICDNFDSECKFGMACCYIHHDSVQLSAKQLETYSDYIVEKDSMPLVVAKTSQPIQPKNPPAFVVNKVPPPLPPWPPARMQPKVFPQKEHVLNGRVLDPEILSSCGKIDLVQKGISADLVTPYDEPCTTSVYNNNSRDLKVKLKIFRIPVVEPVIKCLRNRDHSSENGFYCKHKLCGFTVPSVITKWQTYALPETMVSETMTWLLITERTNDMDMVKACRIWVRNQAKKLHLHPGDEYACVNFVPMLAYHYGWRTSQSTARLMANDFERHLFLKMAVFLVLLGLLFAIVTGYWLTADTDSVIYSWYPTRQSLNATQHAVNGNIIGFSTIDYIYKPILKAGAKYIEGDITKKDLKPSVGGIFAYGFLHDYMPVCFANNRINELAALLTRGLVETPSVPLLPYAIDFMKDNAYEFFGPRKRILPVTPVEYLENSNASPSVKRVLQNEFNIMEIEQIDHDSDVSQTVHKDSARSTFQKIETLLYKTLAGMKEKAPRLIQGWTPRAICLCGPWFMALQRHFKKIWGIDNFITFASGVSSQELAMKMFKGWLLCEDDVSVFDSSIHSLICHFEVWLCEYFHCPLAVLQLIRANIKTHGVTFFGTRYSVSGTRKSGDPFTSLFNSIINGLLHVFIICFVTGWTVKEAKKRVAMNVAGDDNTMAIDTDINIPFNTFMKLLGFKSEAKYRDNIWELEFCSCRILKTHTGWTFAPKPGQVLAKLCNFVNPPPELTQDQLIRGVALGLYPSCGIVAPIRLFLDRILMLTEGTDVPVHSFFRKYTKNEEWHMDFRNCETYEDEENYIYLNEVYGWSKINNTKMESLLKNMQLGDKIRYLPFDMMLDRDTSGPQLHWSGESLPEPKVVYKPDYELYFALKYGESFFKKKEWAKMCSVVDQYKPAGGKESTPSCYGEVAVPKGACRPPKISPYFRLYTQNDKMLPGQTQANKIFPQIQLGSHDPTKSGKNACDAITPSNVLLDVPKDAQIASAKIAIGWDMSCSHNHNPPLSIANATFTKAVLRTFKLCYQPTCMITGYYGANSCQFVFTDGDKSFMLTDTQRAILMDRILVGTPMCQVLTTKPNSDMALIATLLRYSLPYRDMISYIDVSPDFKPACDTAVSENTRIIVVKRKDPPSDLTKEGIEPNPGPKIVRANDDIRDIDWVKIAGELKPSKVLPKALKLAQAALPWNWAQVYKEVEEEARLHPSFSVPGYYSKKYVEPKRLVGIEENPGPKRFNKKSVGDIANLLNGGGDWERDQMNDYQRSVNPVQVITPTVRKIKNPSVGNGSNMDQSGGYHHPGPIHTIGRGNQDMGGIPKHPAQRALVGIESNPGPRGKKLTKRKGNKKPVVRRFVNPIQRSEMRAASVARAWAAALWNPWAHRGLKIGDSGDPTNIGMAVGNATITVGTGYPNNNFVVTLQPGFYGQGSGNGPVYVYNPATAASTLSSTGAGQGYWTNYQMNSNAFATYRTVTCGIKLECTCPMSTQPPLMYVGTLAGSQLASSPLNNVCTTDALIAFPGTERCMSMSTAACWTPESLADAATFKAYGNAAQVGCVPYIVCAGCTAGTTITIEFVATFEATSTGGQEYYTGQSQQIGCSPEQVWTAYLAARPRLNITYPKGAPAGNVHKGGAYSSFSVNSLMNIPRNLHAQPNFQREEHKDQSSRSSADYTDVGEEFLNQNKIYSAEEVEALLKKMTMK